MVTVNDDTANVDYRKQCVVKSEFKRKKVKFKIRVKVISIGFYK